MDNSPKNVPYTRFAKIQIKQLEELENGDAKVKGYASTFGNRDLYDDIMEKGCFKKTLETSKGKWPVLYQHSEAVGINNKAAEDEKGLYVESTIFSSKIEKAREMVALVKAYAKAGFNMGLSIGGLIKNYDFLKIDKIWTTVIKEFQVLEHSLTPVSYTHLTLPTIYSV